MINLKKRHHCSLCETGELKLRIVMPSCPPVDSYYYKATGKSFDYYPLDLYQCETCGYIQLADIVDPNFLFGNYIYFSESSPDLHAHFSEFAEWLSGSYFPNGYEGVQCLDIGANDGLLLRLLRSKGASVHGVDAASSCIDLLSENGIPCSHGFFDKKLAKVIHSECGFFDVVTANNVFSHSDGLGEILEGVHTILAPTGIFIFEVSYALDTLTNRVLDYIYHEHVGYHSVMPLEKFLLKNGFFISNIVRIPTKGGSIRVVARRSSGSRCASAEVVGEFIRNEISSGLYSSRIFDEANSFISNRKLEIRNVINDYLRNGFTVCGYGASATGTVLMRLLDIENYVSFIVDDNHLRQGRVSPLQEIPIVSRDALRSGEKFLCIVLAWRFWDVIVSRVEAGERNVVFVKPLNEDQVSFRKFGKA